MAVSARLSIIGENGYGEQEKDANTVLMELDKGLRSAKVGEQCEAIVRFPRLFEKYPFPILINSAFLKLADVFRVGTNFLRLCILKVTQQSEKHLDKILNVDELVRRLYMVIHSNDPVARAITLRTLGSVACIISERKNVHHSIINGLDSHDSVELEAAIFAAVHFAAQSKSFAASICSKLAEMIEGLATPVETKLKLLPVFQHMHHDVQTAQKVRRLCMQLLPKYPARGMVVVTLHTLSLLSAKTLMDIPQQVELLLTYLQNDARKCVKVVALKDLRMLAVQGPHMWTQDNIEVLCKFVQTTPYDGLKIGGFGVLTALSGSVAVTNFNTAPGSPLMELCSHCCYHSNTKVASKSAEMLTHLGIHSVKGGSTEPSSAAEQAALALEALIIITTTDHTSSNMAALKTCLVSVVKLCLACPSLSDQFVDILATTVSTIDGEAAVVLCECLAALSSYQNDFLQSLVPDITQALTKTTAAAHKQHKLLVSLSTLLFQATIDEGCVGEAGSVIRAALDVVDPWTAYKIARQAMRYGHHSIATDIFTKLTAEVSTEQFYFWLSALRDFSSGEQCLQTIPSSTGDFICQVGRAEAFYQQGIVALKAAMSPNQMLQFQSEYMSIRVQSLQAYVQLIKACSAFQTSPPPAISTSLAMSTGQERHKCDHIIAQLQKCHKRFEELHQSYVGLYQSSFDADTTTLTSIQILQQSCKVMMLTIEIVLGAKSLSSMGDLGSLQVKGSSQGQGHLIEHQSQVAACEEVVRLLGSTEQAGPEEPLSHQHIELVQKAAVTLARVPLCLPRYFVQSLQATSIKLALSPQPRSVNDPISLSHDTHLTLKVEGVIQHGSLPSRFRKVQSIKLNVRSSQQSRSPMINNDSKLTENPTNEMMQTTEPHNDYFSSQFLLAFPVAGLHLATVDASVVDDEGAEWKTGPQASLTIKSYDEAMQRQQQQQYAAHRHQQRAGVFTQF